jgi:hypothetical protein
VDVKTIPPSIYEAILINDSPFRNNCTNKNSVAFKELGTNFRVRLKAYGTDRYRMQQKGKEDWK